MPIGNSAVSGEVGSGSAPATLLQEELRDLRSLVVHADHLRWVTRGAEGSGFDEIVYRFAEDWRRWSECVARTLLGLDVSPDGRVSSLTDGSYRAWLPVGWVESPVAEQWIRRELKVLAEWAHVRKEQAAKADVVELFEAIETGVGEELAAFEKWSEVRAPSSVPVVDDQPRSL